MKLRLPHTLPRCLATAILAALLAATSRAAQPVRVTTWNFAPKADAATNGSAADSNSLRIQEAAGVLKTLNPDVIILQKVPDWRSCDELAKALLPAEYHVAVCSSFRDARTGKLGTEQAAILSKTKAYLALSEAWKDADAAAGLPGGYAFAAIRFGARNVGIFSVQLGGGATQGIALGKQTPVRGDVGRQLRAQIDSLQNWTANRVRGVMVSVDFTADDELAGQLQDVGFASAFINTPELEWAGTGGHSGLFRTEVDSLFVRNAGLSADPQVLPVAFSAHYPVSCELDVDGVTPVKSTAPVAPPSAPTNKAEVKPPTPRAIVAQTPPSTPVAQVAQVAPVTAKPRVPGNGWQWPVGLAGGALMLVAIWLGLRRPRVETASVSLFNQKSSGVLDVAANPVAKRILIVPRSTETASVRAANGTSHRPPVTHVDVPGRPLTEEEWRQRAEEAERQAEQAKLALRDGVIPHLGRWLKEKLVQRLVADRARLMQAQQVAALKALAVDERLSRIEQQLQQRLQEHEARIGELLGELAQAREENREMIRGRIAQVKAEMEKERARAMSKLG